MPSSRCRTAPACCAQARERDAQLARGEAVGPLHGFPQAVKDLTPVKGIPMTQGSPILKDFMPPADSVLAERLRKAGAIIIGKTNTPEFGLGSHTYNPVYGVTRNPYDLTRSAGGSSGGAAVALALRMLPVADGTDYGGSLRNPAGWNNVFGFRTSFGRVPADGRDAWLPSMGVGGPMARNVADLALLLSVQAGYDARAPLSMTGDGAVFRGSLETDLRGKRIAWVGDYRRICAVRARRSRCLQGGVESLSSRSAASSRTRSPTTPSTRSGRPSCGCGRGRPAAPCSPSITTPPNAR